MASVDSVRLASGQIFDITDFGHYPLWSTFAGIMAGMPSEGVWAFNYTTGQTIPGTNRRANELDTNLSSANQGLGYAEEMMVYSITLELPQRPGFQDPDEQEQPDDLLLHDMQILVERSLFQFFVTRKVYSEGVMTRYPFGGGLWAATNINNAELVNNGFPVAGAQRPLALPIHLMSEEPFYALLRFFPDSGPLLNTFQEETPGDPESRVEVGYDIRCWLDGIRRRPVA
jgi:hypothetical protein